MFAFAQEHHADFVRVDIERDAIEIARKLHQLIKAHARKTSNLCDPDGDARDRSHLARRQLWTNGVQRPADPRECVVKKVVQAIRCVVQWSAFDVEGTDSSPC